MSIFNRISDILKANINDLLDRAEDPEKMVKQIIADMEEQVRDATEALGQAMASENRHTRSSKKQSRIPGNGKTRRNWQSMREMRSLQGRH